MLNKRTPARGRSIQQPRFGQARTAGTVGDFKHRLFSRLQTLATESGATTFVMPVGLVLLIDKENGGDATAEELVRRFKLLDYESRNIVDFYFLGWEPVQDDGRSSGLRFNLERFEEFREALRNVGLHRFGGNADLILVDAGYSPTCITMDFTEAIRIDLSSSQAKKRFASLGSFLQSLIEAAECVRGGVAGSKVVCHISDQLGLAIARQSILEFILDKFGRIVGADTLADVAVRNLGPSVSLEDL